MATPSGSPRARTADSAVLLPGSSGGGGQRVFSSVASQDADRVASLTGAAVDALAQQVSVAGVPDVLLDHVYEYIADAHGALVERHVPPEVALVECVEPLIGRSGSRSI